MPIASQAVSLVRRYCIERNLEEIQTAEVSDENSLVFRDANNIILVRVVDVEGLPFHRAREAVENTILALVRDAGEFADKAYLAFKGPSSVLPPPSRFMEAGVGLLIVGEEEVEEKIPPKPLTRRRLVDTKAVEDLKNRLASLDDRVRELEKNFEKLSEDFGTLRREVEGLAAKLAESDLALGELRKQVSTIIGQISTINRQISAINRRLESLGRGLVAPSTSEVASLRGALEEGGGAQLPSYALGNPWIKALSERGKVSGGSPPHS